MTNFLTEKSVTFPNEYEHDQYYSHVEQRTFRSARSTKTNISLFKLFALSLVEDITDAPPKAFVLQVPFSYQENP